ncbi:MAG: polymer-forming cytoskeletal protein [Segetibacter sp.]|jgi:cytoskeletal protein CcmA (bactofilin family)|nr:polymer-forming cytoskeletal protein [Segetibacter sp.]
MIFSTKSKETIETAGGSTTIIGSGVTLTGDISGTADIRIDGTIKGNIICTARVLIGAEGIVEGDVDCKQADVMGRIKGNIKTKELLNLRGKAVLVGDIYATKLQVEPTVAFNGRCTMNGSQVVNITEMSKDKNSELKSTVAK